MALSDSQTGRRPFWRRSESRPPPIPSLPQLPRPPSLHAVLTTPVDRDRCLLVSSLPARPSPLCRRVGIHDFTFEACSSFTRVTAYKIAHPPFVGFIARLRPNQFPGSDARKLSSPTNNCLSGSFPHWRSAPWGALETPAVGFNPPTATY